MTDLSALAARLSHPTSTNRHAVIIEKFLHKACNSLDGSVVFILESLKKADRDTAVSTIRRLAYTTES